MTHVTYKVVRHEDGWAYTADGVFRKAFPHTPKRSMPHGVSLPYHASVGVLRPIDRIRGRK